MCSVPDSSCSLRMTSNIQLEWLVTSVKRKEINWVNLRLCEKTEDSETCQLSNKPNWGFSRFFLQFSAFWINLKERKKISGFILYLSKVTPNCLHSTACSFNIITVGKNKQGRWLRASQPSSYDKSHRTLINPNDIMPWQSDQEG